MSEPLRILIRIIGVVLFGASVAGIALIVIVGPPEVGEMMGKSCRKGGSTGTTYHCTWQDALDIMQALPYTCVAGAALMLTMRSSWVGKKAQSDDSPDLSVAIRPGATASRGVWVQGIGTLAVVAIVMVNFVGVFIYRASYTIVTQKALAEEILRETPRPDFSQRSPETAPVATAPRGLAPGSLLRTGAFRSAMGDVRRAAPAGARLTRLRVAADRIDAEVLANGRVVTVEKLWNAKAKVVSAAPATAGDTPIASFAQLDPAAPQRVARAAAKRPADVDYLVLFEAVGLRWNAFDRGGGAHVSVSPDGRRVL